MRVVALTPPLEADLRNWRTEQAEALLALGVRQSKTTPIATQSDGKVVNPTAVTDRYRRKVQKLGLPPIRLHDLRHSAGSIALDAAVPPTEVAAMLGHTVAMLLRRRFEIGR